MSTPRGRNPNGGILVRCETLDGLIKWRNLPNLDHLTLCRAFGLSEHVTWFDVPRSFGGGSGSEGRKIEGMIHQGDRTSPPIGKITIVEEREKFRDEDPSEMIRRYGWRSPVPA